MVAMLLCFVKLISVLLFACSSMWRQPFGWTTVDNGYHPHSGVAIACAQVRSEQTTPGSAAHAMVTRLQPCCDRPLDNNAQTQCVRCCTVVDHNLAGVCHRLITQCQWQMVSWILPACDKDCLSYCLRQCQTAKASQPGMGRASADAVSARQRLC